MTVTIRQVGPCFAGEVAGIDMRKPLTRDEVVARYARLTGYDVSDYPFFRVLALLKLGVVFLQLHQRWRTGAFGDERYADFRSLGVELLEYTHTNMRG